MDIRYKSLSEVLKENMKHDVNVPLLTKFSVHDGLYICPGNGEEVEIVLDELKGADGALRLAGDICVLSRKPWFSENIATALCLVAAQYIKGEDLPCPQKDF